MNGNGTALGKALTWDELDDLYDAERYRRRPARTVRMETVFEWAERQTDTFYVDPKEGTIHLITRTSIEVAGSEGGAS